jgi:hypothetical protein
MDISLTGTGYLLPMVIIGIVVVIVIAVVFLHSRSKKRQYPKETTELSSDYPPRRSDSPPGAKPITVIQSTVTQAPQTHTADLPKPQDTDLTRTKKDMTESLKALAGKYSLSSFTIATTDGLIFGSSGGESAQTDAAVYSGIFKNDPLIETPGVALFGLSHKGSDLIGIVRAKNPPPTENIKKIATDTKDILNWWV